MFEFKYSSPNSNQVSSQCRSCWFQKYSFVRIFLMFEQYLQRNYSADNKFASFQASVNFNL